MEVKAEISLNLINDIITIFNESIIHLPKKYVVNAENQLIQAKNEAIAKHQQEQEEKSKAK